MIDYKELLLKYMRHVADMEGCTFVGRSLNSSNEFTQEEKEELRRIDSLVDEA
jgi:hypothetical protein